MSIVKKAARKIIYDLPASYVLMFHHVTDTPKIKCSGCLINTDKFYECIGMLSEFESLEKVLETPRNKKIAITFDDGLEDVYTIAYPYLTERKIPFTVFPVTDFLDKPGYITTDQLIEMSKNPFVTIGSHGISHEIFTNMDSEQKKKELEVSAQLIKDIIGMNVNVFAYSHGQYDRETLKYAKCYKYAMSTIALPLNFLTGHKLYMPRLNMDNNTYDVQMQKLKEWMKKARR